MLVILRIRYETPAIGVRPVALALRLYAFHPVICPASRNRWRFHLPRTDRLEPAAMLIYPRLGRGIRPGRVLVHLLRYGCV
jgi:hypothetical protein